MWNGNFMTCSSSDGDGLEVWKKLYWCKCNDYCTLLDLVKISKKWHVFEINPTFRDTLKTSLKLSDNQQKNVSHFSSSVLLKNKYLTDIHITHMGNIKIGVLGQICSTIALICTSTFHKLEFMRMILYCAGNSNCYSGR